MWKLEQQRQKGFSILEVLISLTLIAILTAIIIPSTQYAFRTSLDSFTVSWAGLFREARDHAILKNVVVRVRFDLDKQSYWVEEAPGVFLLDKLSREVQEREESEKEEEEESEEETIFTKSDISKEKQIPEGIRMVSIVSPETKEIIENGLGEIYYFPHGIAETAILNIEDIDGNRRNLTVNPLTGKTKVENGFYLPEGANN